MPRPKGTPFAKYHGFDRGCCLAKQTFDSNKTGVACSSYFKNFSKTKRASLESTEKRSGWGEGKGKDLFTPAVLFSALSDRGLLGSAKIHKELRL
jgi:hypothetical protein